MPNYHDFDESAEFLKVIGHPVRLCILRGLRKNKALNVQNMQCGLDLPQSTVSSHLAKLRAYGVVDTTKNGTEVLYEIKDERVYRILDLLGVK